MSSTLPKRLAKEPLIDAVYELRFEISDPLSNVLPGFLYGALPGDKSIQRLPVADLPQQVRDADINLQFSPLVRLHWGKFIILIGDRNVAVACKLPYPGWIEFKQAILTIYKEIQKIEIIKAVNRYSIKYVDILPIENYSHPTVAVDLDLKIGKHIISKENFNFKIEVIEEGFIHAIQVVFPALAYPEVSDKKVTITGSIVDIDTIRNISAKKLDLFIDDMPASLEEIHKINKSIFFDCLKPETIKSLGAEYE